MGKKDKVDEPVEPAEPKKPIVVVEDKQMAERLEKAADRLEAANRKHDQTRALEAEEKINGVLEGEAAAGNEVKPVEISDKEYAEKVMSGETPKTA